MRFVSGYVSLVSTKLFHRCWLRDEIKTLIIGIHGFVEHGGRYEHVGKELVSNGFSFCISDLRGHGKSAGEGELGYVDSFDYFISDTEEYVKYLVSRFKPSKVIILGHSMGGLIALYYASLKDELIDAVVTSGAATLLRINVLQYLMLKLMSSLSPRKRIALPLNPKYLTHREEVVNEYLRDPLVVKNPTVRLVYELVRASRNFWRYVGSITKPVLLLHGGEDKVVPPEASKLVYERVGSRVKELRIYDGLYHEILNEYKWRDVLKDIINWINEL